MNKLKENGPDLWEYIHKDISRVFGEKNVIIAGGCVRDYALQSHFKDPFSASKYKPKDVDVFVNIDNELDFEFGLLDLTRGNRQWISADIAVETNRSGMPKYPVADTEGTGSISPLQGLIAVADAEITSDGEHRLFSQSADDWWGWYVNILANPLEKFTGAELVSRFDHSLCFVWFTPQHGLVREGVFNKALDTGKIEIINDTPRTLSRVKKVIKRYPDFKCDAVPVEKKIKGKKAEKYFIDDFQITAPAFNIPLRRWGWEPVENIVQGNPPQELPGLPE